MTLGVRWHLATLDTFVSGITVGVVHLLREVGHLVVHVFVFFSRFRKSTLDLLGRLLKTLRAFTQRAKFTKQCSLIDLVNTLRR